MNNRQKGSRGEDLAASFFESAGYRILERNYRRKTGEIDLILLDPDQRTLVFTEVKARKNLRSGYPEEAVTPYKAVRIRKTAQWYLTENRDRYGSPCRFDVISILDGELKHIKNAFGGF